MNPNEMALDLVDEAIDFADELRATVHGGDGEAAVVDLGVDARGGIEAGLLLAEVATGGLATVQTRVDDVAGATLPHVELSTDHPALALGGCQRPGWTVDVGDSTARLSGPGRLLRGARSELDLPTEARSFDFAVLAVETTTLPDASLCSTVATETGVATSGVFVVTAGPDSLAGSVAAAARVAERALDRLEAAGVEPTAVESVTASAAVPPLADGVGAARARAAAAIAEGGRASVVVDADLDDPDRLEESPPADVTPSPAQLTVDVPGGPTHQLGAVDADRLADAVGL